MRVLGVDDGLRRIGLAVSDPTGTLASPVESVPGDRDAARAARTVAAAIARLERADEPIGAVVVGLPCRLWRHVVYRGCLRGGQNDAQERRGRLAGTGRG